MDAYLNASASAQSLLSQLPFTVTLNDSDNDFCGDNIDIAYSESDVTSGYQNGDLVFWPAANNFMIFVNGGEDSASTDNLVKLGRITSPQEMLGALEGQIDVIIARKEITESNGTENSAPSSTPENSVSAESEVSAQEGEENMQIKITVGETELFATLEDNATTRALIGKDSKIRFGIGNIKSVGSRLAIWLRKIVPRTMLLWDFSNLRMKVVLSRCAAL